MVHRASDKPIKLTEAQADVLKFIQKTCDQKGVPPSYREIQSHFGYKAVGTVQDHIKALRKKGYLQGLQKGQRQARGILPKGYQREASRQIPIYGEIAAGATREAEQIELGKLVVSEALAKSPTFALRVVGNSMIGAGIVEGDLLIVDRRARIRTGDIVVALLDGETTVKRYQKKGTRIFLVPENKSMRPIEVKSENFQVQGKVVGLQRKF